MRDSISALVAITVIKLWPYVREQNHFGMWIVSRFSPETCIQIIWKRICLSPCDTNRLLGLEIISGRWTPVTDLAEVQHTPLLESEQ